MKMLLLLWLQTILGLYACNNPAKEDNTKKAAIQNRNTAIADSIATNSKGEILHNIIVHESGKIKIARAYLSFENGSLLPRTNTISLGDSIYLNLEFDKNWLADNRKTSMDASQEVVTDKGEPVVNIPSLFHKMPVVGKGGISRVYLQAIISKTRRDIDYFIIHYRVWDKNGGGEVKGSYRLYIDDVNE
ncbi:MAG: hypothetical protein JWR72_3452 [Flavisolibacter sp.]|jgi:hypothetical protein|nr:hypothetical protein [Flavisolibacter sp.]